MKFTMPLFTNRRRIYLDHAAATPLCHEVLSAMEPYFSGYFGNPSAVHAEGVSARRAIEDARESLARTLHVRTGDVTWTANGTESNNLALLGTVAACCREGKKLSELRIISTPIEHPSILRTLEELKGRGVDVRYVHIHENGRIDEASFKDLLTPATSLVTFAYVNSEIGVVQDAGRIARIVKKFAREHALVIPVHIDASQAPLWLPCQLDMLGVDMMTLDAGKCGGPKGVGVLVHKKIVPLTPVQYGGGQERGLRSGTENTPAIIGCTKAITIAQKKWRSRRERVASLRDRFIDDLLTAIPGAVLNGSNTTRIANNVNISVPGLDTEYAVIALDAKGIAASTQSACSGSGGGASPTVLALTGDKERAHSTIRFTLGERTTSKDLRRVVKALAEHVSLMGASGGA